MNFLLIGNPNSGKTALFNALTQQHASVGNWAGVTVGALKGLMQPDIEITDLPGIYALMDAPSGEDERIAKAAIQDAKIDAFINVIDACQLERHLFLTSELLCLGKPMIVVITMMDLALKRGINIDIQALSKQLGCPVIPLNPHESIDTLKPFLLGQLSLTPTTFQLSIDPTVDDDTDLLKADAHYNFVHQIALQVQSRDHREELTAKIDRWLLHRYLGLPLFFGMMYLMFFFAVHIGGLAQGIVDQLTQTLFVQGSATLLLSMRAPTWLVPLVSDGLGKGLNTTLTFTPVLFSMFFFLSLLESSGYMARAAFVVDRLMRLLGLPGKAFVPLIIGFGCNVPAILATRTLESSRDRILTSLMAPFMSCSARLAIYTVFVAAFFPNSGVNVIFSLYLLGLTMAVLTGLLLRKTILPGALSPLILELPAYHAPQLKRIWKSSVFRLYHFLKRAAVMILPVCVMLSILNEFSLLEYLGQTLTPLFSPMGLTADNWPATVGLMTGSLAKEVVIGSLNSLYSQIDHLHGNVSTALVLQSHFTSTSAVYAYLIFILLYLPCISTMSAIRQETSAGWMWFSIGWSLFMAYSLAVSYYQIATLPHHPLTSLSWLLGFASCIIFFIFYLRSTTCCSKFVTILHAKK